MAELGMKAKSPFCKPVCHAVFRERLFINMVLQHPDPFLADADKGETSQGTESPTEIKRAWSLLQVTICSRVFLTMHSVAGPETFILFVNCGWF